MSKKKRIQAIEHELWEMDGRVSTIKAAQIPTKGLMDWYVQPLLRKQIGSTWECCSCHKVRFYAIEKPAVERLPEETGRFERKVSVCADCEKAFGGRMGANE